MADKKLSQRTEITTQTDGEIHVITPLGGGLFASWRMKIANFLKPVNDAITAVIASINSLSDNVDKEKLNKSTGILYGGELTINADNTKFDITAGKAVIIDAYTDPENPTFAEVEWIAQVGVTVTNLGTQLLTFISVNSAGDFIQDSAHLPPSEHRDLAELGVLVHPDLATLSKATNLTNWLSDEPLTLDDLAESIGTINLSGNIFFPNGANLKINKSAGVSFSKGGNYGTDKKNPNVVTSGAETAIGFFTASGSGVGQSSDIDTDNYNPLGGGSLEAIPSGFVTTHGIFYSPSTGITVVHYGQFLYDSLKEAVDSWEKEEYNVIPQLDGVPLMGVLAFVQGATDLSDPTQAKFIKPGAFGFINNVRVPEHSRYASNSKLLAGVTYNRPEIILVEDAGVIYADVERLGGGNLIFIFEEREYLLDCLTGSGVDGKARIPLVSGSAIAPQKNWVYATKTPGNGHVILNSSISRPTGEFAYIGDCFIQDSVSFLTNKALQIRRWTDAKEFDGRSSIARTNERLRVLPAEWEPPGILQTVTIDETPNPDTVNFAVTAGEVWQKHLQSFPAMDVFADGIYIVNHPTTPYLKIFDLNDVEALQTSDGTTLAGERFNWLFWGVQNKTTGECKLMLNLPNGGYGDDASAVSDSDNTAVTTVPVEFRGTAFLIARSPMRHRTLLSGTYENLALSLLGTQVIDMRGIVANVTGGATSVPLGSSFEDLLFNIYNTLAGFNFRFEASNLTANRILTVLDESGTLPLLESPSTGFEGQAHGGNSLEVFSASKTFDANNGNNQKMLVTASTTIAISDELPGTYIFILEIDTVTPPTITIGASFGDVLDNSADLINADNDINILTLLVDSSGNKYYTINTKTT